MRSLIATLTVMGMFLTGAALAVDGSVEIEVDALMVGYDVLERFSTTEAAVFALMLEEGEVVDEENFLIWCSEAE